MSKSHAVSKWLEMSVETLRGMEAERSRHEAALEKALEHIRQHERAMDHLERDMASIRKAMENVSAGESKQAATPTTNPLAGPALRRPGGLITQGVA